MARLDKIHEAVKNALLKDGWTITHDPYTLFYERQKVQIDLAGDKLFMAEKENRKIAIRGQEFSVAFKNDRFLPRTRTI